VTSPAVRLEALLARLYTDAALRRAFEADPLALARAHGLDEADAQALARIDREGLMLAARSFEAKRAGAPAGPEPTPWWRRGWMRWWRRSAPGAR